MRIKITVSSLPSNMVLPIGFTNPVTPITVIWGDGSSGIYTQAPVRHTYDTLGTYYLDIYGKADSFGNGSAEFGTGAGRITEIVRWGDLGFKSLSGAFHDTNVVSVPTTLPNTVTDLSYMFASTSFNQDLTGWDTKNVTDMNSMFFSSANFNGDISTWNTTNVTNMTYMFSNASAFNRDLLWNTTKVTNMSFMFNGAVAFNRDLSWNTTNVTDMNRMFNSALAFNGNITNWDTGMVQNMESMFRNATAFDKNLSGWDVGDVTNAENIFCGCPNMLANDPAFFPPFSPEPSNYGC